MGLFSAIAGPLIQGGVSLISGGKEKRAIDEARRLEEEQLNQNITGFDEARDRLTGRTQPAIQAGIGGTESLQDLLLGGGRNELTDTEKRIRESALEGVGRFGAANKSLFSGRTVKDFGNVFADAEQRSRDRQIQNLFGLSGQGLQAAGLETSGDLSLTGDIARQRELIGDVGSAGVLSKSDVNKKTIGSLAKSGGNLLELFNKPSSQPRRIQPVGA